MNVVSRALPVPPEHLQEAADWLMKLQGEEVEEAVVAGWLEWCRKDPAHLEAFNDVQRLYDGLQNIGPIERESFMQMAPVALATGPTSRARVPRVSRPFSWIAQVSIAAGIVGITVAVFAAMPRWWHPERSAIDAADYRVSPGEQQALVLADRSRVTIGSASEVVSHFTREARAVDLRAGEAFFEVQPDHARPFVVKAGGVTVTAVGTKFDVRRTSERTIVSVTEGAVDVVGDGAARTSTIPNTRQPALVTPVRVSAGQQAVLATSQPGLTVSDVNPAVATAWRDGRLEYVMEPLSSVIDDVNRYATHRIEIRDPHLRELVFTGTVFWDKVDAWPMTLSNAFPVKVTVGPDGSVLLEARNEK